MSETPVSISSEIVEILSTRITSKDIVLAPSDPSLEILLRFKLPS
jgi:hypothetical protein